MELAYKSALMVLVIVVAGTTIIIQPVNAVSSFLEVAVHPEHPTSNDNVNVSAAFSFSEIPPYVEDFGLPMRNGNLFAVNVTIYVPSPNDLTMPIEHSERKNYTLGRLSEGVYRFQLYVYHVHYDEGMHYLAADIAFVVSPVKGIVNFYPQVVNLESKGKWMTAYIEPKGYGVSDINASSLLLNDTIPASLEHLVIGDHDNDTIPDLMIKFNRTEIVNSILSTGVTYGNVTLSLSGRLTIFDASFAESVTVRVSALTGDVNCDGEVNIQDIIQVSISYGSREGDSNWNDNANFAPSHEIIDILDLVTGIIHYGETYP